MADPLAQADGGGQCHGHRINSFPSHCPVPSAQAGIHLPEWR